MRGKNSISFLWKSKREIRQNDKAEDAAFSYTSATVGLQAYLIHLKMANGGNQA